MYFSSIKTSSTKSNLKVLIFRKRSFLFWKWVDWSTFQMFYHLTFYTPCPVWDMVTGNPRISSLLVGYPFPSIHLSIFQIYYHLTFYTPCPVWDMVTGNPRISFLLVRYTLKIIERVLNYNLKLHSIFFLSTEKNCSTIM